MRLRASPRRNESAGHEDLHEAAAAASAAAAKPSEAAASAAASDGAIRLRRLVQFPILEKPLSAHRLPSVRVLPASITAPFAATTAAPTATIAASPAASFAAALASAATFADAKVPSADTFDRDSFATQTAIAAEAKAESSNRLTSTALTAATEACSAALYPAEFFVQMALDRARHRPGHWRSA